MTSGGDSPGMNAAIRAVVKHASTNGINVIGFYKGYKGLVEKDYTELKPASVENLYRQGGTILKTARYPDFKKLHVIETAVDNCKKLGIEGMVVIGGDGSFKGARDLTHVGIPCVGIPGTIDNDIHCSEDTIGFDSSMNIITDCVSKLRDTSETLDRCAIVEVMGAGAGWMALEGGIATGADVILVPEVEFDFKKDVLDLIAAKKARGQSYFVIIVAECVFFPESNSKHTKNVNFKYVNDNGIENIDKFTKRFQAESGVESRGTVLGHIQRGGAPSFHDCILATNMGVHAVDLLLNNKSKRVVVVKDGKITDLDIDEGLAMKKPFDKERLIMATKLNY